MNLLLFLAAMAFVPFDSTEQIGGSEGLDTIPKYVTLKRVEIVSSPKQRGELRNYPVSSTLVNERQIQDAGVTSLKGVSTLVPNFFMPDYGSRLTSAIYIRGIGSRIGTPVVGVYVDNVPYFDKTAFDSHFLDVERVDVLRGPQSTLYGRNTMGGLVRIFTKSPLNMREYHTDFNVGYNMADNHLTVGLNHRLLQTAGERLSVSINGYYERGEGFFRNDLTGKKVDGIEGGGVRLRALYLPNDRLTLDAQLSCEYSDEGAYPYFYVGDMSESGVVHAFDGKIVNNLEGSYRRGVLNASLYGEYKMGKTTFASVTAWQNVADRMFMDQDFISDDIYSLTQKQKINVLSEELAMNSRVGSRWHLISGATFAYQWLNTKGPVNFRKDGVAWLNSVINTNANAYMPAVSMGPMTMNFIFDDNINGDNLLFDNDFETPSMTTAVFHQSTISNLFGMKNLDVTLGLRLDYEKMWMNYDAWYDFRHTYGLSGKLTGMMNREITMVPPADYDVSNALQGKLSHDYLQLLPHVALKYNMDWGNMYASVSRGYRSGGYNVQNVSELMRNQMTADMMADVRDATLPAMDASPMMDDGTKSRIAGILDNMAAKGVGNVSDACLFRPEFAWNYEVGTHIHVSHTDVDASLFCSNVSDLQLSQMTESGLGRITINAGKSRTLGGEVGVRSWITPELVVSANYGYTYAILRNYHDYDADGNEIDCEGNYVPFMPKHTLNLDAAYTIRLDGGASSWLQAITVGADYSGAGRIYWNEINSASQQYYSQVGARVKINFAGADAGFCPFDVQLFARNIFSEKYNAFWFTSMNRAYEQHGKPFQLGVNLKLYL